MAQGSFEAAASIPEASMQNPVGQSVNERQEKLMKLAEALILRSDLQIRMKQLKDRLARSAKVQDGCKPPENPQQLLDELDDTALQLTWLIQKINHTNNTAKIGEDSLSDLLVQRDILLQKRNILQNFAEISGDLVNRYSLSEIKISSTVDVAQLHKEMDGLSKTIRETDTKIQEGNWTIELR